MNQPSEIEVGIPGPLSFAKKDVKQLVKILF